MATDPLFRMTVEDVFSIKGRGTVATGKIESGTLRVGDKVRIRLQNGGIGKTAGVSGLEMFRKTRPEAAAGDNVGVLLKDVAKNDLQRGDILEADQGMDFSWKP
jgi:elongation factor Tu